MAEDGFSIKDLEEPPEHRGRAEQFMGDVQEVSAKYPELIIRYNLEEYNPEDLEDSIKIAEDEGDSDFAQHLRNISTSMDVDSSESTVGVSIMGGNEDEINLAKEEINVKAIDRQGRVVSTQDPSENMKLPPFATEDNPEGYIDGKKFKANTYYAFGALDEESEN